MHDDDSTYPGPPNVGVGPWPGGETAWPRLADHTPDPKFDPELLAAGDRRNVADEYRYWTVEAIVADLDTKRHAFHIAIENWQHDLNIGTVVRTANAFNARSVHVVGKKRWNRRGAMVTDRYLHVHHQPTPEDLVSWAQTAGPGGGPLPIIGIDNVPGSLPIETYDLPEHCVLVFGQEQTGLTEQVREVCQDVLHITQFGSTRSINAAAAAAIAMHSWIVQHARID